MPHPEIKGDFATNNLLLELKLIDGFTVLSVRDDFFYQPYVSMPMIGVESNGLVAELTNTAANVSGENRNWWNPEDFVRTEVPDGYDFTTIPEPKLPEDKNFFGIIDTLVKTHFLSQFNNQFRLSEFSDYLPVLKERYQMNYDFDGRGLDIGSGMGVMLGKMAMMKPFIHEVWGSNLTLDGWMWFTSHYPSLSHYIHKTVGGIDILEAFAKSKVTFDQIYALRSVSNMQNHDFRGFMTTFGNFIELAAKVQKPHAILVFDAFHTNMKPILSYFWGKPEDQLNRHFFSNSDEIDEMLVRHGYREGVFQPYSHTSLLARYNQGKEIKWDENVQTHFVCLAQKIS